MGNNKLQYHIPIGWVIFLFFYYALLIVGGIAFMLYIILLINEQSVQNYTCYTFYVSMLSSASFASIYYSKKLYKACIDERLLYEENTNRAVILGNIMYFMLRPIFAVAFSVLFVICILGGVFFLMNGLDCMVNERMVYLSAIISCAIGYSIGNVLDLFESLSERTINNIH